MNSKILEELIVVKRSGQRVNFNGTKIVLAIKSAFDTLDSNYGENDINKVYEDVLKYININYNDRKTINVEDIQDIIEQKLKSNKYEDVFNAFNSYRLRRAASRELFSIKQQHKFVKAIENLGLQSKSINDRPLNVMLNFGKTVSKEFTKAYLLESKYTRSHEEGIIFIHDLKYYPLSMTSSSFLDFSFLNKNDLYGYISEVGNILLKVKTEQTGEQCIGNIDFLLEPIFIKEFKSIYKNTIYNYLKLNGFIEFINIKQMNSIIEKMNIFKFNSNIFEMFNSNIKNMLQIAYDDTMEETKKRLYLSLKDLLINLNNINGYFDNNKVLISLGLYNKIIAKTYLTIINELDTLNNVTTTYKIDKIDEILEIVYDLINDNKNIDLSFNHNSEYFSTGEKIYSNINDEELTSVGRPILSTTSINLGRLGLKNKNRSIEDFYKDLSDTLDLVKNQLIQRFEFQVNKYKESFPNLFFNKLLFDSDKVETNQKIRKSIKNGVLNIGLVGIEECVYFLKNEYDEKVLMDILKFINNRIIQYTNENKLNFILSEDTDHRALKELLIIDKAIYGVNIFNKNNYSLINETNINNLKYQYGKIQELMNIKPIIHIKRVISNKKILEVINKAKLLNILYFKIEVDTR